MSTTSLETILTAAWLQRGPLACALFPLSLLFRGLASVRARLYRSGALASTVTLISNGLSSAFSASAVGSVICSSVNLE